MTKLIIFHGRHVLQRTCDVCGRVIYLEETLHRVRMRCKSYMKAEPLYIELNPYQIVITDDWTNEKCTHICESCFLKTKDRWKYPIRNYQLCMYTEDQEAYRRRFKRPVSAESVRYWHLVNELKESRKKEASSPIICPDDSLPSFEPVENEEERRFQC